MTFRGLPVHPLIVHAVVVLLPLAALGTLAVAARQSWRRVYGPPVLGLAIVGLIAVPIATQSGSDLAESHQLVSSALELHLARADNVLVPTIVFVVLLAAAVVAGWRADHGGPVVLARVGTIAGVLAAVAGLVVTALVALTGDAGATATWGGH